MTEENMNQCTVSILKNLFYFLNKWYSQLMNFNLKKSSIINAYRKPQKSLMNVPGTIKTNVVANNKMTTMAATVIIGSITKRQNKNANQGPSQTKFKGWKSICYFFLPTCSIHLHFNQHILDQNYMSFCCYYSST